MLMVSYLPSCGLMNSVAPMAEGMAMGAEVADEVAAAEVAGMAEAGADESAEAYANTEPVEGSQADPFWIDSD